MHAFFLINLFIFVYFAALMVGYLILLVISLPDILGQFKESEQNDIMSLINQEKLLPLTLIIPVYNERNRVLNSVFSALNSDYKNVSLILVNDGSTDDTMAILKKELALYNIPPAFKEILKTSKLIKCFKSRIYPNITVIDKAHSPTNNGADALNAGVNACQTPLHVTFDADTILEPTALSRLLFTFLSKPHCLAVGGAIYVLNDNSVISGKLISHHIPFHFIPASQSIEYLRSFLYGRSGWAHFGGPLCCAGAFTLFETQTVREFGGYDTLNYGYDAEITIRLHRKMRDLRRPYRIHYTHNAHAFTTVPDTLKKYWLQRNHWQRGMLRSFSLHRCAFFNTRYGLFGLFSLPFYLFFEIYSPIIEFLSYILLIVGTMIGAIDHTALLWFLALAWGYISLITIATFFMSSITSNFYHRPLDSLRILWIVTFEMLGFRQYRALCCFIATIQYFFNRITGKPI